MKLFQSLKFFQCQHTKIGTCPNIDDKGYCPAVTVSAHPDRADRYATTALWILRVLLVLAFVVPVYRKFAGVPESVELFDELGFGQWLPGTDVDNVALANGGVGARWTARTGWGFLLLLARR
jgi:hypothetical protein